jgi:hypothetical protein
VRAALESEIMMMVDVALKIRSSSVSRNLKRSAKRSAEKKPNPINVCFYWWGRQDSNLQPDRYERLKPAAAVWKTLIFVRF